MPFRIGVPELLIVLVIVVLLFGAGRVGKIAGEIGEAVRSFRKGISEPAAKEEEKKTDEADKKE
jgi:sec-independent protein translocase protein TatA